MRTRKTYIHYAKHVGGELVAGLQHCVGIRFQRIDRGTGIEAQAVYI